MTNSEFSKELQPSKEYKAMMKDFDDLLNSIDSAGLKEKILWRQIYQNAISDRQSANLCFIDLYPHIKQDSDKHATFGTQLAKYLERMEKSNEQLLKLANLVQKALETTKSEDRVSAEDLYDQMKVMRNGGQEH
jgi:hypothetical protein